MQPALKRIKILDIKNIPSPAGGGAWEIEVAADGHYLVQTEPPTAPAPTKAELRELAKQAAQNPATEEGI
jgi:hypothetical protein